MLATLLTPKHHFPYSLRNAQAGTSQIYLSAIINYFFQSIKDWQTFTGYNKNNLIENKLIEKQDSKYSFIFINFILKWNLLLDPTDKKYSN